MSDALDRTLTVFFLLPLIYVGLISSLTAFRMARDADKQRRLAARYWYHLSSEKLQLPEPQDDDLDPEFVKGILNNDFPERVHGKDYGTDDLGLFPKILRVAHFTRDHRFPKVISYTWVAMFILWIMLLLKSVDS